MFAKLAAWIAGIVRKELAEIADAFGKDVIENTLRSANDLAALKAHVTAELAVARKELSDAKQELIGYTATALTNVRSEAKIAATDLKKQIDSAHTDTQAILTVRTGEMKDHVTGSLGAVINHLDTAASLSSKSARADLEVAVSHIADDGKAASEEFKKHIEMSVAEAKDFMNAEIWKRYETLVKDAAGAARIVDASKIAMAICDVCHLATRRFAVSRINGDIVCAGCAAKGNK